MKWCFPLDNSPLCNRIICQCGHEYLYHNHITEVRACSSYDYIAMGGPEIMRRESNKVYCPCEQFEFKNNDNCSVECQMKYLLELNK